MELTMDKKHAYLFCKFLEVERIKIDEDKWYEGEKISADPGQEFIIDWIQRNAANWRQEWEASVCQHCKNWKTCGLNVKVCCENFEPDPNE
jgi:hypothetical protein